MSFADYSTEREIAQVWAIAVPRKSSTTSETTVESVDYDSRMRWAQLIGQRLRQSVEAMEDGRGMQLQDLARLSGYSISRISNYLHGTRLAGPEEVVVLARILRVRPAWLAGYEDDVALNDEEWQLVRDFRTLPDDARAAFAASVSSLALIYRRGAPDGLQDDALKSDTPSSPSGVKRK